MYKGKKWCPHGCGKKIVYISAKIGYKCEKCLKIFEKNDLLG